VTTPPDPAPESAPGEPVPRPEAAAPPPPNAAPPAATEAAAPPTDAAARHGMTLLEHLTELRNVLVSAAAALLVATGGCWFFSARLLDFIVRPMRDAGQRVFFTGPTEAFMMRLKVSFFCGLFLVLPYVIARLYGFIQPGLYRRERKVVTPLVVSSVLLFYGGVAFSFFLLVPQVVKILMGFGTEMVQPLISVGSYVSFVAQLSLAFGLVFEMPLLVLFLCWIGILDPRALLRTWRYAVVVIALLSGILTPGPDPVSQLVMMVPVLILYLSSVFLALAFARRREAARDGD
jgi:sec-independent protein translocase protein TatC